MVRAFVTVLALLLVMAYVSLFLAWNATPQPITTWQLGALYTQEMPIGILFIAGVLIGAVAMFIALIGPWTTLKQTESDLRALVEKARAKVKAQDVEIKGLSKQLSEARRTPTPRLIEVGPEYEEEATPEGESEAEEGPAPGKGKGAVVDPEVV